MKNVCIFCGSANGEGAAFLKEAKTVGYFLADKGFGLVYGGASIGVMGAVADAVLEKKGSVVGIIPESLKSYEIAHENLTELIVTSDMHTRKKMMYDRSDIFLTIPGGMGTLDEMFEILTWAQLKIHSKTCLILNTDGFYDSLLDHLRKASKAGFIKPEHLELLKEIKSVEEIAKYL